MAACTQGLSSSCHSRLYEHTCQDAGTSFRERTSQGEVDIDQQSTVVDTESSRSESEVSNPVPENSSAQSQGSLQVDIESRPSPDTELINTVAWQHVAIKMQSIIKRLNIEACEDSSFFVEPVNVPGWSNVAAKMAPLFGEASVDLL